MRLHFPKNSKVNFVILAIIVLVGYFGYVQYDSWKTKDTFSKTEQDLDAMMNSLEEQSVTNVQKTKSCQRDHVKFGEGQLWCKIELSGRGENYEKISLGIIDKISTNSSFSKIIQPTAPYTVTIVEYRHRTGSNCYLNIRKEADGLTNVNFYCTSAVNKPIYPVKD